MILVIIIVERGKKHVEQSAGQWLGVLLPGAILGGLTFADLSRYTESHHRVRTVSHVRHDLA